MVQSGVATEQGKMRTVEMRVQPSELSRLMAEMRVWLDERRFEPSSFTFHDSGADMLVRIDFKVAAEAEAFAQRFGGRVDGALAQLEQDLVALMSFVDLAPHGVVG
jgi:hypothetical protein